jgi:methylmalonyl-CoA mutase N-terminal domain/subunit
VERKQAGRLSGTRARRDSGEVDRTLAALKQAASTKGENLMPYFLDAARARASEGEMVAALQEVFGSYTEQPVF